MSLTSIFKDSPLQNPLPKKQDNSEDDCEYADYNKLNPK